MTPEEQRIAIAEACGWTGPFQREWLKEQGREGEDLWAFSGTNPEGAREALPNYFTDLNAMWTAEEVLTEYQRPNYARLLHDMNPGAVGFLAQDFRCLHATSAKRAEAFLRTIGKWNNQTKGEGA